MPRIPYWNIEGGLFIDGLAVPVMALFLWGIYRHWQAIRQGRVVLRPAEQGMKWRLLAGRARNFLAGGVLGLRLYREPLVGLAHGAAFFSLLTLAVGSGMVLLNAFFDVPTLSGRFNRWFMAFGLDLAGLLAMCGLGFLLIRRLSRPARLYQPKPRPGFILVESILLLILASGFVVEGLRLAVNGPEQGAWVGNWLAGLLAPLLDQGKEWHRALWWGHGLLALGLIAWLPFSPLVHLVLVPVNAALANPRPGLKMGVVDFQAFEDTAADQEPPTLGVAAIKDFNQKRLLDFDACLWCGRCQENCPAAQTGKDLSPKGVMVHLAEHLRQGVSEGSEIIQGIGSKAIFQCLTCAACLEACPAFTNPAKAVLRMRQHLVMEQAELPATMAQAHKSLELRQHPFFGTAASAKDWRKGLDVPIFQPGKTEYLLWVGCAATYEDRAQKIAQAMVNILNRAGVSYGILEEARCTGDPAKQMGDEFLFRQMAEDNIERFKQLGVERIITLCPHCYNSFKNYYSLMGRRYHLVPHASLIADLLRQGKISLRPAGGQAIIYHDPCYLGRRNHVLAPPRQVVASLGRLVEFPRHGRNSFCCGGGGGNYWAEEEGERINQARAGQALAELEGGAHSIATACPFCLLMLTDGVKKFSEDKLVFDIAELVNQGLEG